MALFCLTYFGLINNLRNRLPPFWGWSGGIKKAPARKSRGFFYNLSQRLVKVIQSCAVVAVERPVDAAANAGQHPGIGVGGAGRAGDENGSHGAGTLVGVGSTAAIGAVHVVGAAEADAVADFVGQNGGNVGARIGRTNGVGVNQHLVVRIATRGEAARCQVAGASGGLLQGNVGARGDAGEAQAQVLGVIAANGFVGSRHIGRGQRRGHGHGDGAAGAGIHQVGSAVLLLVAHAQQLGRAGRGEVLLGQENVAFYQVATIRFGGSAGAKAQLLYLVYFRGRKLLGSSYRLSFFRARREGQGRSQAQGSGEDVERFHKRNGVKCEKGKEVNEKGPASLKAGLFCLVDVVKRSQVVGGEGAVHPIAHAGQHPGVRLGRRGRAGDENGAHGAGTLVGIRAPAAVSPVVVVGVAHANAVAHLMRHNGGDVVDVGAVDDVRYEREAGGRVAAAGEAT